MDIALTILASLLIVVGLIGTVVPGIPGLPLILMGFLLRSATTDFAAPNLTTLVVLLGVTVLFGLVQLATAPLTTKAFGGSTSGMVGACLGLIAGLLASASFASLLVFPLLGAVLGELVDGKTRAQAIRSGIGATIGFLLGAVFELALGLTFFVVFVLSFF